MQQFLNAQGELLMGWLDWDRLALGGVRILDPDGFRGDVQIARRLFTEKEFRQRQQQCTVVGVSSWSQWTGRVEISTGQSFIDGHWREVYSKDHGQSF